MKTTIEIKKELEAARADVELKDRAYRALDEEIALKPDCPEWRAYRAAERIVGDLEQQLKIAERYEVQVGDGVTYHLYSDSHACTVIKRTAKTITIQEDKATLDPDFKPEWIAGGFAGHCVNQDEQSYTYERNPDGNKIIARWSDKYGAFMYMDKRITNGRHEFYDYNF